MCLGLAVVQQVCPLLAVVFLSVTSNLWVVVVVVAVVLVLVLVFAHSAGAQAWL